MHLGSKGEALKNYQQELDIWEELSQANPTDPTYQFEVARTHNEIGFMQLAVGEVEKARHSYHLAKVRFEKLVADYPQEPRYQNGLALSFHHIATVTRDGPEAQHYYQRAITLQQKLVAEHPANYRGFESALAQSWNNLGGLQGRRGQSAEALRSYERARDLWKELTRLEPAATYFQSNLAASYINIGNLHLHTDRDAARRLYEQARDILEELVRQGPHIAEFRSRLAVSLYNLACVHALSSEAARADTRLSKAEQDDRSETYAASAIKLLRQCEHAGFFRTPAQIDLLQKDRDLDPLRSRADFKDLLRKVEEKRPQNPSLSP
jgi:tetratricopeptide (TPR) repeat protein